jgi:hypothetical protein
LQNSAFHIMQVALFGVLGYIFARLEETPFLLGFVLGPVAPCSCRVATPSCSFKDRSARSADHGGDSSDLDSPTQPENGARGSISRKNLTNDYSKLLGARVAM